MYMYFTNNNNNTFFRKSFRLNIHTKIMSFNNTTNHSLNECFQEYDMKFHEVRIFRKKNNII